MNKTRKKREKQDMSTLFEVPIPDLFTTNNEKINEIYTKEDKELQELMFNNKSANKIKKTKEYLEKKRKNGKNRI